MVRGWQIAKQGFIVNSQENFWTNTKTSDAADCTAYPSSLVAPLNRGLGDHDCKMCVIPWSEVSRSRTQDKGSTTTTTMKNISEMVSTNWTRRWSHFNFANVSGVGLVVEYDWWF